MSGWRWRWRGHDDEDGVISIVIALSTVIFVALLAVVVDLGQIYVARLALVNAIDAAVTAAAEHLAFGGCTEYDEARTIARARLDDVAVTSVIDEFELRYGAATVTDETQCAALAADERVGRLDIVASDTRTLIFGSAFTSNGGGTKAASSVEWGYVQGVTGGMWPFSLCSALQPYQDYLTYLRQAARHDLNPAYPAPDPTLLDPFDMEPDDFDTNQVIVDPLLVGPDENITPGVCHAGAGRMVGLNLGSTASLTASQMNGLVKDLSPHILSIDPVTLAADCGDGVANGAGNCRGVGSSESPDDLAPYRDTVDRIFTVAIHDAPFCDITFLACLNVNLLTGSGRSDDVSRRTRRYPLVNFARVRMVCVRNLNGNPLTPSTTYGSDCTAPNLNWTWTSDGTPDEPMVRLQFVVDDVVREGQLTSTPTYWGDPTVAELTPPEPAPGPYSDPTYGPAGHLFTGFLGMHLCAVDGSDACVL